MAEYRPTPEAVLQYLYGLLDPPDADRVSAWLATPAGEASRRDAESARDRIATAAKDVFPNVRFERPMLAMPAKTSAGNKRNWLGWFVTASLLVAAGFPFAKYAISEHHLARTMELAQAKSDDAGKRQAEWLGQRAQRVGVAEQRVRQVEQKLAEIGTDFERSKQRIQNEIQEKQLSLVISGPETLRAGATNEFHIQTMDGRNQPTPATVLARVKDLKDQIVFEEKFGTALASSYRLQLPADMPLTPNRDLFLEVIAQSQAGPKSELREQLQLAVPDYLTHVTTDKPMYQPGETVFFRSLTVDRFSLKPPPSDFHVQYGILDPKQVESIVVSGATRLVEGSSPILGPDGQPLRGLGAGEWAVPADAPGGEYTLIVRELQNRFPITKRRFLVNNYRPDQIEKELEWSRRSYGPGDVVVANCKATLSNGTPLADRPVRVMATVDGEAVTVEAPPATDAFGRVAIRLTLPKEMKTGAASLNVAFTDGANSESLNKPIPIALKKLDVEFYPEGGELVAGVLNRVYFQVRTKLGKPADIHGRIVDGSGREVARVATLTDDQEAGINQGLGRFEFTPEFRQEYRLMIENPVGIEGKHTLPEVQSDGVVLSALGDISADGEPIRIRVSSLGTARNLLVGAYARGRLLDHRRVKIQANETVDVPLKPEAGIGGVTRITVFEELPGRGPRATLKPVAERLVYRKPAANLILTVKPDRSRYSPGERARLKVEGVNESEQPTPAVIYMGVVNQSVVTMADEKTARSLPTHFLLTSEIQQPEELEHADVLLGQHPKAAAALDLLLGTQGWRRFVDQLPGDQPPKAGEKVDAMLVAKNFHAEMPRQTNSLEIGIKKLEVKLAPDVEESQRELFEAKNAMASLTADPQAADTAQGLAAERNSAMAALQSARNSLHNLNESWRQTLNWLLPSLCTLALLAAIVAMIVGMSRGLRWQIPAAVALSVAAIGTVMMANHMRDPQNREMLLADNFAENAPPRAERAPAPAKSLEPMPKADARFAEHEAGAVVPPALTPATGAPKPAARVGAETRPMAPAPVPAATPATPTLEDKAFKSAPKDALSELKRATPADDLNNNKPPGKPAARDEARGDEIRELDRRKARSLDDAKKKNNRAIAPGEKKGEELGQLGAAVPGTPAPMPPPRPGFGGGGLGGQEPGRGGNVDGKQAQIGFLRKELTAPQPEPLVVRQFAHTRSLALGDNRSDFAETLYWHPALVLPKTGATVEFDLSDSVTRYRILAAGHTLDGRLGSVTTHIEARKPLSLEPKLPVEITAGDRIDVPLSIVNDSSTARSVSVTGESPQLNLREGQPETAINLAPEQRQRQLYRFTPNIVEGNATLRFEGKSDGASDVIDVRLPIVANGFPIVGSISDSLERVAQHSIVLPETWVPGTLHCQLSVFPSTLSELQRGLEGLLREPGGCFEQTSTTNYPNTMILEYLRESEQAEPESLRRARDMLQRGYAKLTSFEVAAANRREGFEWFGQSPAHEALTAYGLMQFRDMARVSDVDPMLLQRTREFLLSRRDGQGGFQRNPRALDTFGRAPDEVTNAYIVWALTESGKEDDVTVELDALHARTKQSKDPYFLALVANALLNRDRPEEAVTILKTLSPTKDGNFDGAQMSITGSTGRTLQIETTALAVLAWLKANRPADFAVPIRNAVNWIGQQRGGYGGFGSTQSTILALKALIAHTKASKQAAESGTLTFFIGEKEIGRRPFTAGESGELTIPVPNAEQLLIAGKNDLRIEMSGKNTYPYTLTWSYRTDQPPSAENCALRLTTKLDKSEIAESDATQLKVKLENVSGRGQGMSVAIVGLPAGLKLPDDFKQLRELARLTPDGKPGAIGAFEVRGRELILYWRDLAPDAKIDLAIDVRGYVPGEYSGPASRAYLYYNSDAKHWTTPLKAVVRAAR